MQKLRALLNALTLGIGTLLAFSSNALAQNSINNAIANRSQMIQDTFQKALFSSVKGSMTTDMTGLIGLMGFLMVVNIFSVLYTKGVDKMLVSMVSMSFWAVIATFVMGGPLYASSGIGSAFNIHGSVCGSDWDYTGGVSLDQDVFNFVKYSGDTLACDLYGKDVNKAYDTAVSDLFVILVDFNSIPSKCWAAAAAGDTAGDFAGGQAALDCIHKHRNPLLGNAEADCSKAGWGALGQIACSTGQLLFMFKSFTLKVILEGFLTILQVIVQIVQFIMMFAMIIGVAASLLFFKLISPFLVLESVRGRVLQAAKVPLAVALYSFTQKTLLYFLAGLVSAVVNASLISFAKFAIGADVDGILVVYLIVLVACVSVLVMQLVALVKVPKIAHNLVNLSLHEFVNLGGEMFKAAIGMAGAAGFFVAGGGLAAAGLSGSSATSGLIGKAAGKLGRFGGMFGGGEGPDGSNGQVNRGARANAGPYEVGSDPIGSGYGGAGGGGTTGSGSSGGGGASGGAGAESFGDIQNDKPRKAGKGKEIEQAEKTIRDGEAKLEKIRAAKRAEARANETFEQSSARVLAEEKIRLIKAGDLNQKLSAGEKESLYNSDSLSAKEREDQGVRSVDIDYGSSKELSKLKANMDRSAELLSNARLGNTTENGSGGAPGSSGSGTLGPDGKNQFYTKFDDENGNADQNPNNKPGDGPPPPPPPPPPPKPEPEKAVKPQNSRNRRTRKGQSKTAQAVREEALARTNTFDEYGEAHSRFDKEDSVAMQREKAFHDSYHGTFGSAEGRKHFAKNAALGGAKVLTNLIAASFDASQGNELGLASLTSGNSHFQEAFNGQGVERYREFRELLEKGEKERMLNAEAGMEAGNALESDAYSVRSNDAHNHLMQDLNGVINGVADERTKQRLLKEMESGKVSGSKAQDDELKARYKEALRTDAEFGGGQAEIEENSANFIDVVGHFVQKSHLTNADVEAMLKALTLTVNKKAAMFYSKHKPRIEALLKAELLASTNLKIKK